MEVAYKLNCKIRQLQSEAKEAEESHRVYLQQNAAVIVAELEAKMTAAWKAHRALTRIDDKYDPDIQETGQWSRSYIADFWYSTEELDDVVSRAWSNAYTLTADETAAYKTCLKELGRPFPAHRLFRHDR